MKMKAIVGRIPAPLSRDESKDLASLEHNLKAAYGLFKTFVVTLAAIKNDKRKLWRTWGSFEGYMEALPKRMGWDDEFSRTHLFRLRKAMVFREKMGDVLPKGNKLPDKETQLRALADATPDKAAEVWQQAQAEEAAGGPKATAARIQELIAKAGDAPAEPEKQTAQAKNALKLAAWVLKLRKFLQKHYEKKCGKALGLLDDLDDELTRLGEEVNEVK